MRRIVLLTALAGVGAIGSAGIANAQNCSAPGVLTSVKGTVLVSTGGGFSPATIGMPVLLGNKVTVQGAGAATATFGKVQVLVPSSSTITLSIPGCVTAAATTVTPYNPTGVIVTTAVIGGGIAAAIALSNDSGSKNPFFPPLSP